MYLSSHWASCFHGQRSGQASGGAIWGSGTISGYDYLQSFIALGVSVIGIIVGTKLSNKAKAMTYFASGLIVMVVADSALIDLNGPTQEFGFNIKARVSTNPQIGVLVVILGGALMVAGGIFRLKGKDDSSL